uniref:Uncharacterized protein n=1 Tax=Oryza meridionalis TaxID=40149 RepID=A0A0E0CFJ0_9ORYZ
MFFPDADDESDNSDFIDALINPSDPTFPNPTPVAAAVAMASAVGGREWEGSAPPAAVAARLPPSMTTTRPAPSRAPPSPSL